MKIDITGAQAEAKKYFPKKSDITVELENDKLKWKIYGMTDENKSGFSDSMNTFGDALLNLRAKLGVMPPEDIPSFIEE